MRYINLILTPTQTLTLYEDSIYENNAKLFDVGNTELNDLSRVSEYRI